MARLMCVAGFFVFLLGCTAPDKTPSPQTEAPPPPAFTKTCEDPRPQMCTREYNPVCATKDTGIRCVTAPCNEATEEKTYPTGCTACADEKVYSYIPGACPA